MRTLKIHINLPLLLLLLCFQMHSYGQTYPIEKYKFENIDLNKLKSKELTTDSLIIKYRVLKDTVSPDSVKEMIFYTESYPLTDTRIDIFGDTIHGFCRISNNYINKIKTYFHGNGKRKELQILDSIYHYPIYSCYYDKKGDYLKEIYYDKTLFKFNHKNIEEYIKNKLYSNILKIYPNINPTSFSEISNNIKINRYINQETDYGVWTLSSTWQTYYQESGLKALEVKLDGNSGELIDLNIKNIFAEY